MEKFYLRSKNLIFYLLLGVTSFIILYPKFPLFNISETYVAIRIEDLAISLLFFVWLILNIKSLKKILNQTITQVFLLFWLVTLLSTLSGYFITHSVSLHLGLIHWLRRVEMMGLFLVAATSVTNQYQIKTLFKTMLIVTMIVTLYGLGQVFLEFPVVSTTNKEFSKGLLLKLTPDARPNSTFAGHYDLAIFLSIVIIFMGAVFLSYKEVRDKVIISISGLISFVLLGLTASRISFASTLLGLMFIFWLNGKKMLILGLIILSASVVVAIPELRHRLVATITVNLLQGGGPKYTPEENSVNIFTPGAQIPDSSRAAIIQKHLEESTQSSIVSTTSADIAPGEPINTTELGVYRSFNIRFDVEWPRALRAFAKNPILGTGYSSITLATDNDYLRSLGETGILGTGALALVFLTIFKRLRRSFKELSGGSKVFILAALCSSLAIGLTALFIDVLEASKIAAVFWIMLGIAWGTSHDQNHEN